MTRNKNRRQPLANKQKMKAETNRKANSDPASRRCSICGETNILTKDHIPPKSCGNKGLTKWSFIYAKTDSKTGASKTSTIIIYQNGFYTENICGKCNNEILGNGPDEELKKLKQDIEKQIENKNDKVVSKCDISLIAKAAIGHILSSRKYYDNDCDNQLRKFLLENIAPNKEHLFLFLYPYKKKNYIFNHVYPIRIPISSNKHDQRFQMPIPECGICGIYFYPLAFILSESDSYGNGMDLFNLIKEKKDSIIISKKSWFNTIVGSKLPTAWPLEIGQNLDDINAMTADKSCLPIITQKKQTISKKCNRKHNSR